MSETPIPTTAEATEEPTAISTPQPTPTEEPTQAPEPAAKTDAPAKDEPQAPKKAATPEQDVEAEPAAADVAREISGRTNIPVVVYPDASHHVEPSNADVEAKLRELSLI